MRELYRLFEVIYYYLELSYEIWDVKRFQEDANRFSNKGKQ